MSDELKYKYYPIEKLGKYSLWGSFLFRAQRERRRPRQSPAVFFRGRA